VEGIKLSNILLKNEVLFKIISESFEDSDLPVVSITFNFPYDFNYEPYEDFIEYVFTLLELLIKVAGINIKCIHIDKHSLIRIYKADFSDVYSFKKILCSFEEALPFGRILDIDIYLKDRVISREEINFPKRKCYLCKNSAIVCRRKKRHKKEEIHNYLNRTLKRFQFSYIVKAAFLGLLMEAALHPKPGLVTPYSTGSNSDMNFYMFIKSASCIALMFDRFSQTAFLEEDSTDINRVRQAGLKIESEMFKCTNGVNTHKGAIFLFGCLIYSMAKMRRLEFTLGELQAEVQKNFKYLSCELKCNELNSHSYIVYKKYGLKGIRGEIERGFPSVIEHTVPCFLKAYFKLRSLYPACQVSFLKALAVVEDTNVVYRSNLNVLKKLQSLAEQGDVNKIESFIRIHNLNPGGVADCFALSLFLISFIDLNELEYNKNDIVLKLNINNFLEHRIF